MPSKAKKPTSEPAPAANAFDPYTGKPIGGAASAAAAAPSRFDPYTGKPIVKSAGGGGGGGGGGAMAGHAQSDAAARA